MIRLALLMVLFLLQGQVADAHQVRPGLLLLRETGPGNFEYLWRRPLRGGVPLEIEPRLPQNCGFSGVLTQRVAGAYAEQGGELACDGGLRDAVIEIAGLRTQSTDVLVRVEYAAGGSETLRATPDNPVVKVTGPRSLAEVSATYLGLGVKHILLGIDHLLFVAALLMLVAGWRRLVATVTAFTLAHSVTLAGATLGFLSAPPALIEVLIALSIVFVAAEVIHLQRGQTTWTTQRPWLVAFAFGLLHGFGFAASLREVGLPADAVPAALLFFNVGVEIGQLVFVAIVLVLTGILRRVAGIRATWWKSALASAIGILAAFWTFERAAAIWA